MNRGSLCALSLIAVGVFASTSVIAATEARVDLSVMVPPVQRMEVVHPALVMPELTVDALVPGYVVLPRPVELRIASNTDWVLQMRMDERADGLRTPRHEILCSGGEKTYRPVSDAWIEIAHGGPGRDIALELRVRVALEDAHLHSGAYETRFDYRLEGAAE
jgi:hypothetical protein